MRDNLVRVDDPVGGGIGYGNLQSIFAGPHPELGLTEESQLPVTADFPTSVERFAPHADAEPAQT